MKWYTLFALVLGAGLWSGTSEAAVPAFACNGCSPLQEEQKALGGQPRGYRFVYNIANKRIRKFEAVLMANGNLRAPNASAKAPEGAVRILSTNEPADGGEKTDGGAKIDGGATIDAGPGAATRELWEHPVDAGVRRLFDTLVSVETRLPGVTSGQRAIEVPIRNIGLTPGPLGPRAHDPREIAWFSGSPRGYGYNDFMNRLREQLSDRASTERISDELADYVHDFQGQTGGVSVSVGLDAVSAGVSWDRIAPTVELKLCDSEGNCVKVIVKKEGNYVQVTYEDTTDRFGVSLPNEQQARGVSLEWRQNGREGANGYADWLSAQGRGRIDYIGGSQQGCQRGYILSCVRIEGTTMLACQIHCR